LRCIRSRNCAAPAVFLYPSAGWGQIIGSDVFGNAEYYLGMCAGAVRYACVTLVVLAFLNAATSAGRS